MALIVLGGLVVYVNGLGGGLVGLDIAAVEYNPHLRLLSPLSVPLGAPSGAWLAGAPLASLTLAWNYALGGLSPRGYLVFNLGLHLASTLLLFGLVRRVLLTARLRTRWGHRANSLAAATALLWMVHPVVGEAVRYISARPLLLAGAFTLALLYCLTRGATGTAGPAGSAGSASAAGSPASPGSPGSSPVGWGLLALLAALGAVLSHPLALAGPLLALLLDRAVLAGSLFGALRARWWLYIGLILTWLVPLSVVLGGRLVSENAPATPLGELLTQAAQAPGHYLRAAVIPFGLAPAYDDIWMKPGFTRNVLLSAGFVLLLLAAWWLWRNALAGVLAAGLLLCAVPAAISPALQEYPGALPAGYLPMTAVIALLVGAGVWLLARVPRPALVTLAAALLLGLGWLNVQRAAAYRSEEAFWNAALAARPASAAAYRGLAREMARQSRADKSLERIPRILELLERAVELTPHDPAILIELAQAHGLNRDTLGATRELRKAEELAEGRFYLLRRIERTFLDLALFDDALRLLRSHLERYWRDLDAHLMMGELRLARNQPREAVKHFEEAVKIAPRSARALSALGLQLIRDNQLEAAAERLQEAIQLAPQMAEAHFNLGQARLQSNRPEEALASFRMATRLEEHNPILHYFHGLALQLAQRPAEAEAAYERCLRLDSTLIPAQNNLAWLYATSPDEAHRNPGRAVELSEQVRDNGGKYVPNYADTLAAAYAAAGRFAEAIEAAELAIELWRRSDSPGEAAAVEARLALYRASQPYIEQPEP